MIRRPLPLAALAGAALLLAGCGGTKFVLVENQGAGAAPAAATATTAVGAVASADDKAAVEEVIATSLTLDEVPFEDRLAHIIDGDDLEPTVDATIELASQFDVEVTVGEVTIDGDNATATTSVEVDGEAFAADLPVTLQRVDGEWKITRAGACTVLALASPCPDAPTS